VINPVIVASFVREDMDWPYNLPMICDRHLEPTTYLDFGTEEKEKSIYVCPECYWPTAGAVFQKFNLRKWLLN